MSNLFDQKYDALMDGDIFIGLSKHRMVLNGVGRSDWIGSVYVHAESLSDLVGEEEAAQMSGIESEDGVLIVEVGVVAPGFCKRKLLEDMCSCLELRLPKSMSTIRNPRSEASVEVWKALCQECVFYGYKAVTHQQFFIDDGRTYADWALKSTAELETFAGFYLDQQMNAIGATGWDFLAGDPTVPITRRSL